MSKPRCIYITGGSSGIGLAIARAYSRAGESVVLLARDQDKLDAAVVACRGMAKDETQCIAGESVDVTDYEALPGALDALVARYGLPDLVVLSAGVAGNSTFLDTTGAEFERVLDINLGGSREVARMLLAPMLQRGGGQIVFISSLAGLMGMYGYSAYAASKFALTGMVQALRQEVAGSGVSVQLVCPPEVATPMIAAESSSSVPQTRFLKDLVGTLEPNVAARKIISGIERRKAVIVPGVRANILVWIARHFPNLFARSSEFLLRWKFK